MLPFSPFTLSRRQFGSALIGAGLSVCQSTPSYAAQSAKHTATDSLAVMAARKGIAFGAAVRSTPLLNDPEYAAMLARECAVVVPENDLKWWALQPRLDQPLDVSRAKRILAFAQKHHMKMRGHTLIWHNNFPKGVDASVITRSNAQSTMRTYIHRVAGDFKGHISSWDVVNEAIELKDGRADHLRQNLWLDALGPEYIDLAFHIAKEADPRAQRVYNDYHLEYAAGFQEKKRHAFLALLDGFKQRNVPCDAVGIQAHLVAKHYAFDAKILRRFLQEISDRGFDILITELDVEEKSIDMSLDIPARDQAVSDEVKRVLEVMLDEPRVKSVLTWGITDKMSWLNEGTKRPLAPLRARPLPFDEKGQRKPMWDALAHVFKHAPQR
jgi:endo-1,4-beta-xylanase